MSPRWYQRFRRRARGARREGRAAATGLLTGTVAGSSGQGVPPGSVSCPACDNTRTVAEVIDVVDRRISLRCDHCRHRWTVGADAVRPSGQ